MVDKKRVIGKARKRFLDRNKLNSPISNLTIRELFMLEKELGFKIIIDNN